MFVTQYELNYWEETAKEYKREAMRYSKNEEKYCMKLDRWEKTIWEAGYMVLEEWDAVEKKVSTSLVKRNLSTKNGDLLKPYSGGLPASGTIAPEFPVSSNFTTFDDLVKPAILDT